MTEFNVHLINRNIGRYGKNFVFRRPIKNQLGEDTSQTVDIHRLRGIFHNARGGYSAVKASEETRIREKPAPMIICLFADTELLRQGDLCSIGGGLFKITAVDDIEQQGEIAEISLEAVL